MPQPFQTILGQNVSTYTLLLWLGIALCLGMTVLGYRWRHVAPMSKIVDACLVGLFGGLVLARGFHVLLNWSYFRLHVPEITQISAGGLNWHGAVLGALVGIYVMASWRKLKFPVLLDALAWSLPIMALFAWWGCGAAHCSYGAEVGNLSNYPGWLVWEERDIYNIIAPRYAIQPLGMAFSILLMLGVLMLSRRNRAKGVRFWVMLALLAFGMFISGFLRGDYAPFLLGLRADQWLDVGLLVLSGVMLWYGNNRRVKYSRVVQH